MRAGLVFGSFGLTRAARVALAMAVLGFVLFGAALMARAQELGADRPGDAAGAATASDATAAPDASDADLSQARQDRAASTPAAMPAAQIIEILRSNPEVMVEVKSVITDALQQQGVSVDADVLTDEAVYTRLETSSRLRLTVTEFLRARGYVSEADIQEAQERNRVNPERELRGVGQGAVAETAGVMADGLVGSGEREDLSSSSAGDALAMRRRSGASRDEERLPVARRREPNLTDEPSALRRPAPYNLRSLRDLYSQVPESSEQLKRFGSDLFVQRGSASRSLRSGGGAYGIGALDVPLGPDYVLGPGDELSIHIWGGVTQHLLRLVDREGQIEVPEGGLIAVAGSTMANAQAAVESALQAQYRNVHVSITVSQLRSVRVFVVGDVQRPGSYEVSALASPISALFAAGGPTAAGSLRVLRQYRGQKLVGEIDLYDFMLHGIRAGEDRLQAGDTLVVPPLGAQVAVFGAVKRPAIYELRSEGDLGSMLDTAGGVTVAAALSHITIERIVANQHREEISVEPAGGEDAGAFATRLRATPVKDGDRVRVGSVLAYDERSIYVQGHVARPGRIAYRDNMRLTDVIASYQDLLPEPADHGEIVRLVAPDLHPETIEFSVPDVLVGNANVALQPFDTIRVFGRYEQDAPTVSVRGEVQRPGTYPLFKGMSAAELVRTAGGFKRDAFVERADLASYAVQNGTRVAVERRDVAIGDAVLKGDGGTDVALQPGDVLTVHQITGWNDIGASIIIEGEVAHPGSYGFQEGEHLSDVVRRAGGFRPSAYPEGAVLTRPGVATLEEKSRQELIHQIETASAAARTSPAASGSEAAAALQAIQQQQDQVLAQLRNQPATGRLVIHINSDIDRWAGSAADVEVRSGDVLRVPKRPGFVLITGQVYNPSAMTFFPGKSARWYLQRAGGSSSSANRKEIFIVRANGDVIGRRSGGWYGGDVLSTKLDAGDTIVVPQKIVGPSLTWRNLLGSAQVLTSLALAAGVAAGL